jgi:hypothetical protein
MRKEFGGMGIPNLQDLNLCLLGSWIKRYIQGEGTVWRNVVDSKYNTRDPNILCCHDAHPSTYWKRSDGCWRSSKVWLQMEDREW